MEKTIYKELLEIMNQEGIQMRRELHMSYCEFLKVFFCENDIERSLNYFLAMPSESRKGRSSISCILECCEVAKTFREEDER